MFCNVVLISAVRQSESAIYIHISPLSWISLAPCPTHLGHRRGKKTFSDHNHSVHRVTQEFFSGSQILTRSGRASMWFFHLILKVLAEIPWAPDALFLQPLDNFLHLVKNQGFCKFFYLISQDRAKKCVPQ